MTIKHFHIFFIVASIALSGLVTALGIQSFLRSEDGTFLVYSGIALIGGVILVAYSQWFSTKMKTMQRQLKEPPA